MFAAAAGGLGESSPGALLDRFDLASWSRDSARHRARGRADRGFRSGRGRVALRVRAFASASCRSRRGRWRCSRARRTPAALGSAAGRARARGGRDRRARRAERARGRSISRRRSPIAPRQSRGPERARPGDLRRRRRTQPAKRRTNARFEPLLPRDFDGRADPRRDLADAGFACWRGGMPGFPRALPVDHRLAMRGCPPGVERWNCSPPAWRWSVRVPAPATAPEVALMLGPRVCARGLLVDSAGSRGIDGAGASWRARIRRPDGRPARLRYRPRLSVQRTLRLLRGS